MVEYSDNEEYRPLVNELLAELLLKLPNNVLIDNDIICTPFYNNMLSSKKFSFSLQRVKSLTSDLFYSTIISSFIFYYTTYERERNCYEYTD